MEELAKVRTPLTGRFLLNKGFVMREINNPFDLNGEPKITIYQKGNVVLIHDTTWHLCRTDFPQLLKTTPAFNTWEELVEAAIEAAE